MEYSHFKEHTDRVVESCSQVNGKDHAFKGICKDCGQRV